MKFSEAVLYPNEQVSKNVLDYAAAHTTSLPKHLLDYHAEIVATQERSEYMISTFQAAAMTQIARMVGAKRVLEIGVYVGFSAMSWAHAVGPDGSITGLESLPKYAEFARNSCKKYGVENVEIITGDAAETLKTLSPEQPYDLIFIDANKTGYPDYLKQILSKSKPSSTSRLLRPGGLILADNVFRRGLVADDSDANPHAANERAMRSEYSQNTDLEKLREYNDMCVSDPKLESWLMPLWDGINVARLVD